MATKEQQDYQKSIIAFVAGVLIGGLVVWMFSSPSDAVKPEGKDSQATAIDSASTTDSNTSAQIGSGSVEVTSKVAGESVAVEVSEFPADHGWVAVRDVNDGVLGNMLGATEYNVTEGRIPTSVGLFRATEAGKTYKVVFYTENHNFDAKPMDLESEMVKEVGTEFTAE